MSGNITLRLDEKLVRRIRRLAVDANTSVSAWVGQLVTRAVEDADGFERARRQALAVMDAPATLRVPPLTRDETHER